MSFEDELHAALDDPTVPVQQDTAAFAGVLGTVPVVVDTLLHHPDRARRTLRHAFTAFHQAVLAADWPRLHAQLAADVACRARFAARHGVDAMLATLCPPHVRWEYPLRALADRPRGTTELAAALGVTPATASTHVANLRRAGLVFTTRVARTARHEPTPLGRHMLDGHIG
jgi:hypothetical protein